MVKMTVRINQDDADDGGDDDDGDYGDDSDDDVVDDIYDIDDNEKQNNKHIHYYDGFENNNRNNLMQVCFEMLLCQILNVYCITHRDFTVRPAEVKDYGGVEKLTKTILLHDNLLKDVTQFNKAKRDDVRLSVSPFKK